MTTAVTISLVLTGTDDDPRWAAWTRYDNLLYTARLCCDDGHWTPEAAAAHALEIATAFLVGEVRNLEPGTAGALALQRAAA